jgi:hypothetical protein
MLEEVGVRWAHAGQSYRESDIVFAVDLLTRLLNE